VSESIKIKHEIELDVQPLEFHFFNAARHLNAHHFAAVEHARIEIGHFKSDCCQRMVYAVVKKGVVTDLEMDPCTNGIKVSNELAEVVRSFSRKVDRDSGGARLPMPLDRFVEIAPQLVVVVWTCIRICAFGYCVTCCQQGDWVSCSADSVRLP